MDATGATTVLVVDDHELICMAIVLSLRAQGFNAHRCVGPQPATVLEEAARHGGAYPPARGDSGSGRYGRAGVVLLDLDLGLTPEGEHIDGNELIAPLRTAGWAVLVLTGSVDRNRLASAVAAGAVGWVPKSAPFDVLLQGVLAALAGRELLSPAERADLLIRHRDHLAVRQEAIGRLRRLSSREREVLARLVEGHQAASIAEEFVTSLATVRAQIRSILAKLEVTSQLGAVALAHRFPGEFPITPKVLQSAPR